MLGDSELLIQAVVNLIINATQALADVADRRVVTLETGADATRFWGLICSQTSLRSQWRAGESLRSKHVVKSVLGTFRGCAPLLTGAERPGLPSVTSLPRRSLSSPR